MMQWRRRKEFFSTILSFFILLQQLLWLITAKALSLTNPTVLAQLKPHLLKKYATSNRSSAPHVFPFVTD